MSDERQVLDIGEQEAISDALMLMIQQSPMIIGRRITTRYEDMATGVIGLFTQQGTVYLQRYLSGSFAAQYSFCLRYRIKPSTDEQKISEQERLDAIAKWLEGQKVTYGGQEILPPEYPELTDRRTIEQITRTSNAVLEAVYQDGAVDYVEYLTLRYRKQN